jgi:hypothetical protein
MFERIEKRERAAPRVADDDRPAHAELRERVMNQLHLIVRRCSGGGRACAVSVARPVERDHPVGAAQRIDERKEILNESRVTVQQHDGRTRTPVHIVEADTVHGHKLSYGRKSRFSAPNLHLCVDGECGKNYQEPDTDANKPLPDRHVAGASPRVACRTGAAMGCRCGFLLTRLWFIRRVSRLRLPDGAPR